MTRRLPQVGRQPSDRPGMAQRNSLPPQRHSNPPNPDRVVASPRARTFPVLATTDNWTIDTLREALGPPDPALAPALLQHFREDDLAKYGNSVASERLLRATPTIVSSTLQTLAPLDAANVGLVLLPPGIFAAIVDEAAKVPALAAQVMVASKKATVSVVAWKASRKAARQEAVATRDRIVRAVGQALGATHGAVLKATAGNADDDGALVQGITDLADSVEQTLSTGSPAARASLGRYCVDAACVTQLRAAASAVKAVGIAPAPAPSNALQRTLDLQEGRVLALLDAVVGAMRSARASNKAIPLPDLGPLRAWFMPPRGKGKSKGDA